MLARHPNASLHARKRNFASRLRHPAETPRLNATFVHGRTFTFPCRRAPRRRQRVELNVASPTGVKTHASTAEWREWPSGDSSAQNTSSHRPWRCVCVGVGGGPSRLTLLGRITQQYVFLWLINLNGWL